MFSRRCAVHLGWFHDIVSVYATVFFYVFRLVLIGPAKEILLPSSMLLNPELLVRRNGLKLCTGSRGAAAVMISLLPPTRSWSCAVINKEAPADPLICSSQKRQKRFHRKSSGWKVPPGAPSLGTSAMNTNGPDAYARFQSPH